MTPIIRGAHPSDLPYLYGICLKTADSGKDATALYSDPWLVGQYFAAPYLVRDSSLCFVAEEEGIPKGYIVAADDTEAFDSWLDRFWLPPLRARYPLSRLEAHKVSDREENLYRYINRTGPFVTRENSPWLADYPAHLHIDLLPDLQGKGCGRLLMERLFEALAGRGCPGVHLGVDGQNLNAVGFYRKLGFEDLERPEWGFMLGKKI